MANQKWTRKEHTTKGFDPTAVVTWADGSVTLTEFQQVVIIEKNGFGIAHTFRTLARLEEQMMRSAMPRTNAADPVVVNRPAAHRTWMNGRLVTSVKPLTFTLAEVTRVAA